METKSYFHMEKIKIRFLDLLRKRQSIIAQHTLAAWDSSEVTDLRYHLEAIQDPLHKIAGTAGTLGYTQLGQTALDCENIIIKRLNSPDLDTALCLEELLTLVDTFTTASKSLLTNELI